MKSWRLPSETTVVRQEGVPLKAPRGEIEKPETLTKQAEHIELSVSLIWNMMWNQAAEEAAGRFLFDADGRLL